MLDLNMDIFLMILGMAAITYLTRISGFWLTHIFNPQGRLLAALEILPGSILLSLVAPVVFATGIAETVAALVTVAVTLKTGRFFLGVCIGVFCVFLLRNYMI